MRRRSNSAFYGFLALLIVVISVIYVWKFLIPSYQSTKSQISILDKEVRGASNKLESIRTTKTTLDQIGIVRDEVFLAVPEGKDTPNLITELEALVAKEKMVIPSIQIADQSSVASAGQAAATNAISINFALDGGFTSINNVIAYLEKDIRFMNIQGLSLAVNGEDKTKMNMAVDIEAYIRGELAVAQAESGASTSNGTGAR